MLLQAVVDFSKAIEIEPRCMHCYKQFKSRLVVDSSARGTARALACKLKEAVIDFSKAIEIEPRCDIVADCSRDSEPIPATCHLLASRSLMCRVHWMTWTRPHSMAHLCAVHGCSLHPCLHSIFSSASPVQSLCTPHTVLHVAVLHAMHIMHCAS
jgi:hypothetical protein